jgi:hypothetical protein
MLSQTNMHCLAINKLDLFTAHNRCLRIMQRICGVNEYAEYVGINSEIPWF